MLWPLPYNKQVLAAEKIPGSVYLFIIKVLELLEELFHPNINMSLDSEEKAAFGWVESCFVLGFFSQ